MFNITDMDGFLDSMNKKPNISIKSFTTSNIGNVQPDLCSRQIIDIPADKTHFRQLLPVFKREIYDCIDKDAEFENFSQITNASELCEYHCNTDFFVASKEYMTYIRQHNPNGFKVNVYSAETTNSIPNTLAPHIVKNITLPSFQYSIPAKVKYAVFDSHSYNVVQEATINGNTIYILNINLPFSYYSRIPVMDSTFSYDINSEQFYLFDVTLEEGLKHYKNMIKQKSIPGIYICINENIPNPIDLANVYILIAKLYKLPYIPASLIMTGMPLPFLEKTKKQCEITVAETNELCKPYFLFPE